MNKSNQVATIILALVFLATVGSIWKWVFKPQKEANEQVVKQKENEDKVKATGSQRKYDNEVRLALDGFSGYSVLRSTKFRNMLGDASIRLELDDDGGSYVKRLERLQKGEIDMAAFTVDALLKASATLNDLPATIVLVIDESGDKGLGADAIVAYTSKYPNIDSLNNPETKFVLVPDSPSEMLVRVLLSSFELSRVHPDCFVKVNSPKELYEYYRKSHQSDSVVFVGWQPTIGKMLQNPNVSTIVNSSNFQGYIVDVLVSNRDFLIKNPKVVKQVVSSHLRASYEYRDQMQTLVLEDAKLTGEPMSPKQAADVAQGIKWRNTLENYAILGVQPNPSLLSIEDIIRQVNEVLLKSKATSIDPVKGQPNLLYYNKILQELLAENFHPGSSVESDGTVQSQVQLEPLSEEKWSALRPVAALQTEEIVFAPGTDQLTSQSKESLARLAASLRKWPTFYVRVQGTPRVGSNPEAAKSLALTRAQAAAKHLSDLGIDPNRIKATVTTPGRQAQVSFVLGQPPY